MTTPANLEGLLPEDFQRVSGNVIAPTVVSYNDIDCFGLISGDADDIRVVCEALRRCAHPTPSKGLLRGHRMTDKKSNEQRYYDTLKEITNYMAPNKIRKDAHNLGLSEEEYLEMAYDNIRATATAAIHNKRRPQA